MRIISGIYRGRQLKTVPGLDVRPTSDRLRETLFNILAPDVRQSRFLDICAGSGAVGIEALSRGAESLTLIDKSRPAVAVIEENLKTLGITSGVRMIQRDAVAALRQLQEREENQFDIVFFDPPYAAGLYSQVMQQLASGTLLHEDSLVIAEYHKKQPPEPEYDTLRIYRDVKQGESGLAFYALERPA